MADNDQVVSKSDFLILKENTYYAGNGVNGSASGPNLTLLKVKVNVWSFKGNFIYCSKCHKWDIFLTHKCEKTKKFTYFVHHIFPKFYMVTGIQKRVKMTSL